MLPGEFVILKSLNEGGGSYSFQSNHPDTNYICKVLEVNEENEWISVKIVYPFIWGLGEHIFTFDFSDVERTLTKDDIDKVPDIVAEEL